MYQIELLQNKKKLIYIITIVTLKKLKGLGLKSEHVQ